MKRYVFTAPFTPGRPHIHIYVWYIWVFYYWFRTDFFFVSTKVTSAWSLQYLVVEYFYGVLQLPERTSKYFKPFQRQHYANEAELEKPLKSFPLGDWRYLMVLCQLPSMTILQRVALCWVKAYCLQLPWIFVSLKSSVQRWTLLFTLWKPAEGDHFKHLQKTRLLSMHNNGKSNNWLGYCLFVWDLPGIGSALFIHKHRLISW